MRTLRLILYASLLLWGTFASGTAHADQTGVAYDEITWRGIDVKPLAPGSFQSDRETLMKRVVPADRYPDLHGNFGGNLGAGMMTTTPQFVAIYRYSYLGDLIRVDDPIAQTATISRPDLGQTIFLNLKTKTYHTAKVAPPPAAMPSPGPSASPAETPAYNYRVQITAKGADPLVIDGMQTIGMAGDGTLTTLQSTPTCIEMQGSMHWLIYQSLEYPAAPSQEMPKFNLSSAFHCAFEPMNVPSPSPATAAMAASHLYLYMSLVVSVTAGPLEIRPIQTVIERGNIARLGPADASLFDIPADFVPQGKVS